MNGNFSELWQIAADERAPWILSLAIIMLTYVIWLQFSARIGRLEQALDKQLAVVQSADGHASFKQRYGQLFADLASNPLLGDLWRSFASTVTADNTSSEAIGYTRRPRESYNDQVFTAAGIDMRFYGSVPNLLVGAGLLFSFVGIVSALYFASLGVASESVTEAQLALGELLRVATFKFLTSITGLAASLMFSWGEKNKVYAVHRRLQRLNAALEARMVPVTAESLNLMQLNRLRSMDQQLARLARSVYVRVPEALDDALADELRTAMKPLHQAIARAADEFKMPSIEMPSPPSAVPLEDGPAKPSSVKMARTQELAAVTESRFDKAIQIISDGLNQMRGGAKQSKSARAALLEHTLENSLPALRDAKHALKSIHDSLENGGMTVSDAIQAVDAVDKSVSATRDRLLRLTTPNSGKD